MVTLVGEIYYGSLWKRLHFHDDLRKYGVQEIEWLEIPPPPTIQNVGDLMEFVCLEYGINDSIRISYMNSFLSSDVKIQVLQNGTASDIVCIVPIGATEGQTTMEEVIVKESNACLNSGIGSSSSSASCSSLDNSNSGTSLDEGIEMMADEVGSFEQNSENQTFNIDTNANMTQIIPPSSPSNLADDPGTSSLDKEGHNENAVSTPVSYYPESLNAPDFSPIPWSQEEDVLDVDMASVRDVPDEVPKLARKLKFSEEERPEGLKSPKMSKTSNNEEEILIMDADEDISQRGILRNDGNASSSSSPSITKSVRIAPSSPLTMLSTLTPTSSESNKRADTPFLPRVSKNLVPFNDFTSFCLVQEDTTMTENDGEDVS